jgi:type I restriction enzyme M protein
MRKLRRPVGGTRPGRCGMVVPNGTLFGDGICARIKEELLKEFNLHTIVRLPDGVFAPYTDIPTNLLFFERSGPTKEIWYYAQTLPEGRKKYTKTQPIRFEEFSPCLAWWEKRQENEQAWRIKVEDVLKYDAQGALVSVNLDIRNPRAKEDLVHQPPDKLVEDLLFKERRILGLIEEVRTTLQGKV